MMFVARDDLTSVLEKLSRQVDVWVPASSSDRVRVVQFLRYRPGMAPILDCQSTMPPKSVVLPQVETILRFEYRKDPEDPGKMHIRLDDDTTVTRALVFGARPCDVRGVRAFDSVFTSGPYADKYYGERRGNTLFATLVCRDADSACFCSSVGSGPTDMDGSDIRITPVEGGLVLEGITERALPLLESLRDRATAAQEAEVRRVQEEAARQHVGDLDIQGCAAAFRERFEDREFWQIAAGGCLSCGICTFMCPTCYCFTITDEMPDLKGERIRSWDSCMYSHYTLEASGHNPRPTKIERYRNRVGHKFSYFPDKYGGSIACCGCGRCVRSCPASIDIRRVVENLKEKAHACS